MLKKHLYSAVVSFGMLSSSQAIAAGELNILKALEDELLLMMPISPLHGLDECEHDTMSGMLEAGNSNNSPFQVLRKFKTNENK